jgi:hypothetical protein
MGQRIRMTWIALLVFALGLSVAPFSAAAQSAGSTAVSLNYGRVNWWYKQVPYGTEPNFMDPDPQFDTSSWQLGQAGFGTTNSVCSWNTPDRVHTEWDTGTDMLLRHDFTIPVGASSVHITGTIDNNADVYVNGTLMQHVENGFCAVDGINVDVPATNLRFDNVIAIRARDLGDAAFVDVRISYVPQGPMDIRAGDFNGVAGISPPAPPGAAGNKGACTAGFAVVRGTTRYMLTTAHCLNYVDKDKKTIGQADLVDIVGPVPPGISSKPGRVNYATDLDCSGSGSLCLRRREPDPINHSVPDYDVMAWRPDPGIVIPRGEVQVDPDYGVPVLGDAVWQPGQRICQMGVETVVTTGGEKCGSILKKSALQNSGDVAGYVAWQYPNTSEHLEPGDSGGPVYAYVYNPDRTIKGVSALGINTGFKCNSKLLKKTVCTNYFLPIQTIMQNLDVNVLNTL